MKQSNSALLMLQKSFRKITKTEIPQTQGTCKKSLFTPQPDSAHDIFRVAAEFGSPSPRDGSQHTGSHPAPSAEPFAPQGSGRDCSGSVRGRTPRPPSVTSDLYLRALAALEGGPASCHPTTWTAISSSQDLTWNLGPVCQQTAEPVQ